MEKISVAVSGAFGRMGKEVCLALLENNTTELVGAFDLVGQGEGISKILSNTCHKTQVIIESINRENLQKIKPQVLVDFSTPVSVMQNVELALKSGVRPVVGTTGITRVDLDKISRWTDEAGLSALVAPNFSLGAVLMMKFASLAARYFPCAEIIELHHDQKMDAPSGTALKTAEMIARERKEDPPTKDELFKLPGARGGVMDKVHIHSIRLKGMIAHQEVIFGGLGQTLTIRHDTSDRSAFMPGVIMAVQKVMEIKGLIYGLENLLEL